MNPDWHTFRMSDNLEKCSYYLKIVRLLVDVGTEVVRELFYHYKPRDDIKSFFKSSTIIDELRTLRRKNVLNQTQLDNLLDGPDPDQFDISLLVTLLTNLSKFSVECPKNGWNKKIQDDDHSLGADLIRLRDIRNTLIGHRPNARISEEVFEKLWKLAEEVLLRLATCLGEEHESKFREKIQLYKSADLEANKDSEKEKQYLDLLQKWYDEGLQALADLQAKAETYLKKAEEFLVFFKNPPPERFWRYVLLLYEGGMKVGNGMLQNYLQKKGEVLEHVLSDNLAVLQECPSVFECLFADNMVNVDTSTWGLTALIKVIRIIFRSELDSADGDAFDHILTSASEFATIALDSLNIDKLCSHWTQLVTALQTLALGLSNSTLLDFFKLVSKHEKEMIDMETAKSYVAKLQRDCHPFKNLMSMYLETNKKLKQTLEQMRREGVDFRREQVVELKMMIFGEPEEKRELAETILNTVWEEALTMTGNGSDFGQIKEAVKVILTNIKSIKGASISSVEKHCILVKILCKTSAGLLELLEMFDVRSPLLDKQDRALSDDCKSRTFVTAFVTLESLLDIMKNSKACEMTSLSTPVVEVDCVSYSAVRDLHQLMKSDSIQKAVRDVSTLVSAKLNADVSVKLDVNFKGFSEVLDESFEATSLDKVALYGFWVSDYNCTSPTSSSSRTSMVSSGTEEMLRKSQGTLYTVNPMKLSPGRTGQLFDSMAESSNGQNNHGSNHTIAQTAFKRVEGQENKNAETSKTEFKTFCDQRGQRQDVRLYFAKTGVDNAESRRLEISMCPLPASMSSQDPSQEPDATLHVSKKGTRKYVDNPFNRRLGRVGLPVGSLPVSKHSDAKVPSPERDEISSLSKKGTRTFYGFPVGSLPASKRSDARNPSQEPGATLHVSKIGTKTYADNPLNRRLGRVGLPIGSAPVSKHFDAKVPSPEPGEISSLSKKDTRRYYVDNDENRRLGRVGLPIGSLTMPKVLAQKTRVQHPIRHFLSKTSTKRTPDPESKNYNIYLNAKKKAK